MSNKKIVITGVTRGLGLAMATEFINAGHTIAGIGRDQSQIQALTAQYPKHQFNVVDITDAIAVDTWKDSVVAKTGVPDIVINNAGVINANAPLWEVPNDEFSMVMDVNIKGVFHVIKSFVPAMSDNGGGVIINFSSGWGRSVAPDVAPYCASKWAIEGMSKALADELPAGMTCVALNPGVIHTEMLESCFGDQASQCIKPADWAGSAVSTVLGITGKDNGSSLTV